MEKVNKRVPVTSSSTREGGGLNQGPEPDVEPCTMTWLKILLMWPIMFLQVIFVATNRNLKGYTEMKSKSEYHKLIIKIKKDERLV
jgi:hypothetical protein